MKPSLTLSLIFFISLAASIFVMYQKYMVREDIVFFAVEEDIPDPFDLEAYK